VEKNEISFPKNKKKCIPQLHDFRQREQPPSEHRVAAHIIPTTTDNNTNSSSHIPPLTLAPTQFPQWNFLPTVTCGRIVTLISGKRCLTLRKKLMEKP
jgi:hypothetical protein